jgi:hypothetical protein
MVRGAKTKAMSLETIPEVETIFARGMGEGCILEANQTLEDFYQIESEPVKLGTCLLEVGKETTMDGWFNSPVVYCGKQGNKLFFFLGNDSNDLFARKYYETMLRLDENKFFRMYSWKGGRDCNFINGKWK